MRVLTVMCCRNRLFYVNKKNLYNKRHSVCLYTFEFDVYTAVPQVSHKSTLKIHRRVFYKSHYFGQTNNFICLYFLDFALKLALIFLSLFATTFISIFVLVSAKTISQCFECKSCERNFFSLRNNNVLFNTINYYKSIRFLNNFHHKNRN